MIFCFYLVFDLLFSGKFHTAFFNVYLFVHNEFFLHHCSSRFCLRVCTCFPISSLCFAISFSIAIFCFAISVSSSSRAILVLVCLSSNWSSSSILLRFDLHSTAAMLQDLSCFSRARVAFLTLFKWTGVGVLKPFMLRQGVCFRALRDILLCLE